jgi:TIR domain-containing protein
MPVRAGRAATPPLRGSKNPFIVWVQPQPSPRKAASCCWIIYRRSSYCSGSCCYGCYSIGKRNNFPRLPQILRAADGSEPMPATFSDVGGGNWIFVSHSNKDLTEVRGIRNFLETKRHNPILFYLRSLQDDDLLPDFLKREIEARNFFVLCNSPNAGRSIWVQEEIRMVKAMPEKIYEEIDLTRDLEGQIHKLAALSKRATVYISHTLKDQEIANRISRALADADFRVLTSPLPGDAWQAKLAETIAEAMQNGFVLVLVGSGGVGPWVVVEYYEAMDDLVSTGKGNIIPVMLNDSVAPGLPFWRSLTPFDFKGSDFAQNMRGLILELKTRKRTEV